MRLGQARQASRSSREGSPRSARVGAKSGDPTAGRTQIHKPTPDGGFVAGGLRLRISPGAVLRGCQSSGWTGSDRGVAAAPSRNRSARAPCRPRDPHASQENRPPSAVQRSRSPPTTSHRGHLIVGANRAIACLDHSGPLLGLGSATASTLTRTTLESALRLHNGPLRPVPNVHIPAVICSFTTPLAIGPAATPARQRAGRP